MNCPCEECICIPICRHKDYVSLFQDCSILKEYEPGCFFMKEREIQRIETILNIIKSTVWEYRITKVYKGKQYRLMSVIEHT